MGDFYQNGVVTTLHNLRKRPYEELESEMLHFSKRRPMSLILPCLYSELEGPALENIVQELKRVPYLEEVIIGLDKASKSEFEHAKKYFSRLRQHHRILWNDGPRMKALDKLLIDENIAPREMGKGRNWRFNHSALYLQFLAGTQQYACTPWGTPTRNIFGWQRPCYLINDGYTDSFRELMATTNWDHYGAGKDPRCRDCMVHCGFEPTAVMDSVKNPLKALRIYLKHLSTTHPGFPKFSY